jgi:hypothetical protein
VNESAVDRAALPDSRWARWSGGAGLAALTSYISLMALPAPPPVQVLLVFGFAFGLTVASLGLHLGVTRGVAPRLGLVAAVANTVAAGELTAMLLVQMAVKAAVTKPEAAFTAIWLGLDVAWDLFVGAGTLLFGLALWRHPRFRPLTASGGVLAGLCLLVLNVATFPIPPAEAGFFDAGPLVGLWYVVLSVRVLVVALREPRPAAPAAV